MVSEECPPQSDHDNDGEEAGAKTNYDELEEGRAARVRVFSRDLVEGTCSGFKFTKNHPGARCCILTAMSYIAIFTNLLLLVASFTAGFLLGCEYERTRHLRTRNQHSPLAASLRL